MGYAGSGSGTSQTADERRAEATRILKVLESCGVDSSTVSGKEGEFLEQIGEPEASVSPKQLWWLRDIKAKYAE